MGATKMNIHKIKHIDIARVYKAFGHPARIAIIEQLLKYKECNGLEFTKRIKLSQSTLAQHLDQLVTSGVLNNVTTGHEVYYSINGACIVDLYHHLTHVIEEMPQNS